MSLTSVIRLAALVCALTVVNACATRFEFSTTNDYRPAPTC